MKLALPCQMNLRTAYVRSSFDNSMKIDANTSFQPSFWRHKNLPLVTCICHARAPSNRGIVLSQSQTLPAFAFVKRSKRPTKDQQNHYEGAIMSIAGREDVLVGEVIIHMLSLSPTTIPKITLEDSEWFAADYIYLLISLTARLRFFEGRISLCSGPAKHHRAREAETAHKHGRNGISTTARRRAV